MGEPTSPAMTRRHQCGVKWCSLDATREDDIASSPFLFLLLFSQTSPQRLDDVCTGVEAQENTSSHVYLHCSGAHVDLLLWSCARCGGVDERPSHGDTGAGHCELRCSCSTTDEAVQQIVGGVRRRKHMTNTCGLGRPVNFIIEERRDS